MEFFSVVLEAAELNVGGASSLDVEGLCKMTFLHGLGDGLGWDFAKEKLTETLYMKGFLPPSKCKLHTRCPVLGEKFFLDILCNQRFRKFFSFGKP